MQNTASPASQEIQAIFNRIAPVYDQLNHRLSLGQHQIWKLMAVKWSRPFSGAIGLDICCGSGDLTQLLARQIGMTGHVTGLDFSAEQLKIAHQRACGQSPHLPIVWQQGDALNLPFDAESFDCATMGYGLRNVIDIPRCLQELYRVLKPSARAAILDFHRPHLSWLRTFQQWYLASIVVPAARELGLREEYAYIAPSLDRFPTGIEQVALADQVGFADVVHYPIASGMMGVLVVTKP